MIYFDDHEPAHVHVHHAGTVARVLIGDETRRPRVADPGRMRTPDVRRALRVVEADQQFFLEAWRSIHGT